MRKIFLGLGIVISGFAFSQQFGLKQDLTFLTSITELLAQI
jgi:hypothetical protein